MESNITSKPPVPIFPPVTYIIFSEYLLSFICTIISIFNMTRLLYTAKFNKSALKTKGISDSMKLYLTVNVFCGGQYESFKRKGSKLNVISRVVGSWKFFGYPKPNRRTETKAPRFFGSVRYELTILVVSNDILQNFFNFNNFTKNYLKKGVGIRLFGTDFAHK